MTSVSASNSTPRPARGKEFYTAVELAERWGVSVRHVRRLIYSEELVAHNFGRAVRISLANVLIYEVARTGVI
jgi:excisionase family DNA binding protein